MLRVSIFSNENALAQVQRNSILCMQDLVACDLAHLHVLFSNENYTFVHTDNNMGVAFPSHLYQLNKIESTPDALLLHVSSAALTCWVALCYAPVPLTVSEPWILVCNTSILQNHFLCVTETDSLSTTFI